MSNHPTIAALKAALESEREIETSNYGIKSLKGKSDIELANTPTIITMDAYYRGHEAATERLMTIVEKAVKIATDIERGFEFDGDCTEWQLDKDDMRYLAREFLTTLADASGEIKKENDEN